MSSSHCKCGRGETIKLYSLNQPTFLHLWLAWQWFCFVSCFFLHWTLDTTLSQVVILLLTIGNFNIFTHMLKSFLIFVSIDKELLCKKMLIYPTNNALYRHSAFTQAFLEFLCRHSYVHTNAFLAVPWIILVTHHIP